MSNGKKQYDKIFEKIKEFKQELSKQSFINENEKNIVFEKFLESIFNIRTVSENKSPDLFDISGKKEKLGVSTFASLINRINIKSHTDIVLLATFYLVIHRNYESVTVKEILEQYKLSKRKPSTNTSVYISSNLKNGHMMLADKKDSNNAYTITHEGIQYVEEMLKNEK